MLADSEPTLLLVSQRYAPLAILQDRALVRHLTRSKPPHWRQQMKGTKKESNSLLRWRVAGGASAVILFFVLTVSSTSAAFTASQSVISEVASGSVELSSGGVSRLTFGGADLAAIGPGTSLTQTVTVVNSSTVTIPTPYTEVALWADSSGAPLDTGGLGQQLQVVVTRSIGGGSAQTLYSGAFDGLAQFSSFVRPVGATWRSKNASSVSGTEATRATYTFVVSLPASATSGSNSQVGTTLVFEARNVTQ